MVGVVERCWCCGMILSGPTWLFDIRETCCALIRSARGDVVVGVEYLESRSSLEVCAERTMDDGSVPRTFNVSLSNVLFSLHSFMDNWYISPVIKRISYISSSSESIAVTSTSWRVHVNISIAGLLQPRRRHNIEQCRQNANLATPAAM